MTDRRTDRLPSEPRGPSRWLVLRSHYGDRLAAALLVPVLGPVATLLALAVRWRDGSPTVIGLDRAGRHGVPFRMWKLRTIRVLASDGSAGGAVITSGTDPRVTPIGASLRRWRLDELPQLINVLKGDMALLGPRPETPTFVDTKDPAWAAVLRARPGVAGPTQLVVEAWETALLQGDGHEDRYRQEIVPVKLALDRWYVEKASPLLDLGVCWSMVERFLLRRPDTWVQRRARREVPEARRVPVISTT